MERPAGNVTFTAAISFSGTRRNYRWSDRAREEGEGPQHWGPDRAREKGEGPKSWGPDRVREEVEGPQSWGPDRAREEGEGPQSCFWCPHVAALTRAAYACALSR